MRFISAELTNFCQFRHIQVKFAPGLTAILGRNGSGKSNLVKALYAIVGGDFARNDGVKIDNINQLAQPNATAKVSGLIEHAGTKLHITRSLRPVSMQLAIIAPETGSNTIVTKASEANEQILDILGISGRMLSDYVFVDQWSIFDFLSMSSTERAKAFQRLFHTEHAEVLWRKLGDYSDKIVIPTPGICRDAVIKRLTENQQKEGVLSNEQQQLAGCQSAEDDRRTVADWEYKCTLEKDVDTLQAHYQRLQAEYDEITANVNAVTQQQRDIEEYLSSIRGDVEKAEAGFEQWRRYGEVATARTSLESQLSIFEQDIVNLVVPQKPDNYVGAEKSPEFKDWWDGYNERVKRYTVAQHFTQKLSDDDPFCPTCGTPRKVLEKHRTTYATDISKLQLQLEADDKHIEESRLYRVAKHDYNSKLLYLHQERDRLKQQLSQIVHVQKPTIAWEEFKEILEKYSDYAGILNRLDLDIEALNRDQLIKISNLKTLRDVTLMPKGEELSGLKVTKEDFDAAQTRLLQHEEYLRKKANYDAELTILCRAIRDDELTLQQLESIEVEADGLRAWSDYCLNIRSILHRDNLPRLVAQNYLELMQDEVNALLQRFESPFRVETDANLSFTALFNDGRKIPASRLSGGEKVILAIAFRVTVNDIFARDLGMLVLDEPTAGLDDGNLGCLKVAIERLKELSTARGLQVIMITHEKELSYLFDHTIELEKELT